jgi:hypothetical protein
MRSGPVVAVTGLIWGEFIGKVDYGLEMRGF